MEKLQQDRFYWRKQDSLYQGLKSVPPAFQISLCLQGLSTDGYCSTPLLFRITQDHQSRLSCWHNAGNYTHQRWDPICRREIFHLALFNESALVLFFFCSSSYYLRKYFQLNFLYSWNALFKTKSFACFSSNMVDVKVVATFWNNGDCWTAIHGICFSAENLRYGICESKIPQPHKICNCRWM